MKKLLILAVIIIAASNLGYTQTGSLSASDINKVDIDDLSDSQIENYIKKAEESGLSEQQLYLIAKQRGVSDSQIQKLKARVAMLGSESSDESPLNQDEITRVRETNKGFGQELNESMAIFEEIAPEEKEEIQSENPVFGSEIFQNVDLNFEPSLNTPTPQNYQIGSGDEIILDVWGASEQSYALLVSPDGSIKVANLGPIYINGLSIEQASQKVKRRMSKIYSGLYQRDGEEPNTYFQLSLGNLRSVNVNVIGEATYPGTYVLSSFSNMFNAIYYAGGPNENGSMRDIQLIRGGTKIADLDIYDYLKRGVLTNNEKLQDQDVILIQPYLNRVSIKGEVKRPAVYETKEGETLSDLLEYTGGFNGNAYQAKVTVKRNTKSAREITTIDQQDFSNLTLRNGDQVTVNRILDKYTNRVQIIGAVNMPGEYELKEGFTLQNLIQQAEGLREDAFTGRGLIVRLNSDLSLSNHSFNVRDIIQGNAADVLLKKEDIVKISSIFDIMEPQTLTIKGEVLKSGTFPYIGGMTVEDLIILSGGLKESASTSIVEVARRIENNSEDVLLETAETFEFSISEDLTISDDASNFILEPYDLVTVRRVPGFTKQIVVEMEGEVKYPGKYVLKVRNERISDLIKRAGGLTPYAYPKGAQLIRRTQFYNDKNSETNDAVQVKKESLLEIADQDSLVTGIIKDRETVGIDLVDILNNPKSLGDIRLQEGDVVSIPKGLETVRISGEVLYPITTRFITKQTFKDYLSFAGGASDKSRVGKSFVIYPNGTAARTKGFLWFKSYPKIEPGSQIIIPKKPDRQRLSIQEILAISTTLTTMALLVDRLSN